MVIREAAACDVIVPTGQWDTRAEHVSVHVTRVNHGCRAAELLQVVITQEACVQLRTETVEVFGFKELLVAVQPTTELLVNCSSPQRFFFVFCF